ncbi:MAG: hypothetical protein QOF21_2323, partial [Actinomycetota bacterium]
AGGLGAGAAHPKQADVPAGVLPSRADAVVTLLGAQLPAWSRLAATGAPKNYPSGATKGPRSAHNGRLVVPPDTRRGVNPSEVVAYRWDAKSAEFVEIPVQVDQRFPYFLANPDSDFGIYSGTDTELTYQWDAESWRMTEGVCAKQYPANTGATTDPVTTLDDDDEVVFMASDAGSRAPTGQPPPKGTHSSQGREVSVVDPLRPLSTYVYLFLREGGSQFDAANGYVHYERHADADQWIDRDNFAKGDYEQLGSSNTGYGPNLAGTVCDPNGNRRQSKDRFPRDGVTVSTAKYRWTASGRWMIRGMQVAKPGQPGVYGPDLVDRWKGRAFQSSPDSSVSLVGFEDEQVNWEANSSLLGERAGPVRAIREVWGADSGTNVTKTETFYRNVVTYRYRVRVHPIPPDGLYMSWDYNADVATRYFNTFKPNGVRIDGVNDEVYGNVDEVGGQAAFVDIADVTFDVPIKVLTWEQVSGHDDLGSLVYVVAPTAATSFASPTVAPYYRDDKCFDDGTGDNPVKRPWPGEASTDERVQKAYGDAPCDKRQGAWGQHGVHFFVTGDTDNAFVGTPVGVTELDATQWQFAVPTKSPKAVGEPYAQEVRVPLIATAATYR